MYLMLALDCLFDQCLDCPTSNSHKAHTAGSAVQNAPNPLIKRQQSLQHITKVSSQHAHIDCCEHLDAYTP